jgi:hypothetical protein
MKTFIAALAIAISCHLAHGEDLVFQSQTGETLILEKSIQWISQKPDFLEIGTSSGVFQVKGGKVCEPFNGFVSRFNLNAQQIFYKSVCNKRDSEKVSESDKLKQQKQFIDALMAMEKKEGEYHEKLREIDGAMCVSLGSIYGDFSCDSIVFRPHDH